VLLTRAPLSPRASPRFPCDLHVLSMPPAFVLSQDQTLQFKSFGCSFTHRNGSSSCKLQSPGTVRHQPKLKPLRLLCGALSVYKLSSLSGFQRTKFRVVLASRRHHRGALLLSERPCSSSAIFLRDGRKKLRRRPTLPHGRPCSTIGAGRLNFRVRDGIGCDPAAIATGNW
jgi:hypothetical protein